MGDDVRTDEDRIQEVLIIEGHGRLYEDTDFLAVKQSLYANEAIIPSYDDTVSYVVWCRPQQIYKNPMYFSETYPDYPYCVTQGSLPDDVFMGVLMAVAVYPRGDLLQNVFSSRPEDFVKFGVYTCRFYVEGNWVDVITDSSIPCLRNEETGEFTPAYSSSVNENELWVSLAEKAYAKAVGNYEALQKVRIREALMHLTGGSVQQLFLQDNAAFPVENDQCAKLWSLLNRCIRTDTMVLLEVTEPEATGTADGNETEMGAGIFEDQHSFLPGKLYSVVDIRVVDGAELVLMHDPWSPPGTQAWRGDYSVGSSKWDANNGEHLESIESDEAIPWKRDYPAGYFWIPIVDLRKYFNSTHLCKLFPEGKFTFFCMPGDWHRSEAGGPLHSVRDKALVRRDAHRSKIDSVNNNTCAVVVDGDSQWFNNPQYRITTDNDNVRKPTIVYISLVPVSADANEHGVVASLTVTSMPRGPETSDRVWDIGACEVVATDKVDGAGRNKGQEVSVWALKLEADKVYHILPCTLRKGQEASFIVRMFSLDKDVTVESLDKVTTQCFNGEWRRVGDLDTTGGPPTIAAERSSAAGATLPPAEAAAHANATAGAVGAQVENSKWCQNPQYHLEVIDPYAKEDIHLKVVVRRTDKGAGEGGAGGRRNNSSMIGNISDLKAEMTVGLTVAKADCLEDLTPTKQVKKGPRQNALGQFIAAKPSSLKKKHSFIEDVSQSGSSTGKTILRKASLTNPVGYNCKTSFSGKTEAVVYYPRLPRSWVGNGLILIPSLSEKGVKGTYELEINCSEPLRVRQLPDAFARTVAGEWKDNECGGNHLSQLWKMNPKYVLKFRDSNKGSAPARTRITLCKHGDKWKSMSKKDTVGCMIGFYVFVVDKSGDSGGGAGDMRLVYEAPFAPDETVSTDADFSLEGLGEKQEYVVMPTTFNEEKKGAFVLSVSSEYEYTLVKEK